MKTNGVPVFRLACIIATTFVGVHLAGAAAGHGEVLGGDVHGPAEDRALPGDHAVGGQIGVGQAEVGRPVLGEHAGLLERARVEQRVDPLTCGELALGALLVLPLGAATQLDGGPPLLELGRELVHGWLLRHRGRLRLSRR